MNDYEEAILNTVNKMKYKNKTTTWSMQLEAEQDEGTKMHMVRNACLTKKKKVFLQPPFYIFTLTKMPEFKLNWVIRSHF